MGLVATLPARFDNHYLTNLLAHPHAETVKIAVVCLSLTATTKQVSALANLLHHHDPFIVRIALHALSSIANRAGSRQQNFLLRRAIELMNDRDHDEAMLLLNRILVENPQFAEAFYQRAVLAGLNANHRATLEDCCHAVRLNRHHHEAYVLMGHAHAQLDQYAEALESYYRALEIHPRLVGLDRSVRSLQRLLKTLNPNRLHIPNPTD